MTLFKKDVTPLLTHWNYVLLALSHQYSVLNTIDPKASQSNGSPNTTSLLSLTPLCEVMWRARSVCNIPLQHEPLFTPVKSEGNRCDRVIYGLKWQAHYMNELHPRKIKPHIQIQCTAYYWVSSGESLDIHRQRYKNSSMQDVTCINPVDRNYTIKIYKCVKCYDAYDSDMLTIGCQ